MKTKASTYRHGLPFSEKLGENLKDLDQRVIKNKASLYIADGGVGEGKTTLLVETLDYFNMMHNQPKVSLVFKDHPQLGMGGTEFTHHLRDCQEKDLCCTGYDEGGDFNKRGALSKFNQMINRTFETFRGFKIRVGVSLPNFNVLDKGLFDNNIPRLLLHCYDRGDNYGNFKAYSLVRMNWIRYWYDRLPKGVKYKCYDKVQPNFFGHFLDLEPERARALDLISTKGKLTILAKHGLAMEGLMNYYELAKKLNRSISWVKQMVGKLDLNHKRIVHTVKYFDEFTFNKLADYIEDLEGR